MVLSTHPQRLLIFFPWFITPGIVHLVPDTSWQEGWRRLSVMGCGYQPYAHAAEQKGSTLSASAAALSGTVPTPLFSQREESTRWGNKFLGGNKRSVHAWGREEGEEEGLLSAKVALCFIQFLAQLSVLHSQVLKRSCITLPFSLIFPWSCTSVEVDLT